MSDTLLKTWVEKNRVLCEVFLDAYCIVDRNAKVMEFNSAFMELCGESYRKILKIGNFFDLVKLTNYAGGNPIEQVIQEKRALRIDELTGSSKAVEKLQMIFGAVPIFSDAGDAIGALVTIRNVSAESELQKKYDERKRESAIDGLTRLYNKMYTESLFLRMLKGALRDSSGMSVVMCDIDHFKKVNDSYGHQAGDYVLSTVAQMLKGESRDTDIVGRFGGEEFVVVLYNSDQAGAQIFAERFRNRVAATEVVFEGRKIPVTVSLGTATFNKQWKRGDVPEEILKDMVSKADTALYFAKANGRNQTCQFEKLPATSDGDKTKKKAA